MPERARFHINPLAGALRHVNELRAQQLPGPRLCRNAAGLRVAVAVSDELAARDLRRVRDDRVEMLVNEPLGDERRRLVSLRGGLEEPDRAHDAVAGLDEVV